MNKETFINALRESYEVEVLQDGNLKLVKDESFSWPDVHKAFDLAEEHGVKISFGIGRKKPTEATITFKGD